MAETIESFVAKLQAEGVEAGEQAAQTIRSEAQQQADRIVADAEAAAARIKTDAEKQAADLLARSQTELQLAARDIVLKLGETLKNVLKSVLLSETSQKLSDGEFLIKLLHDLTMRYADADIDREQTIMLNVSEELQGQVADWALNEMTARKPTKTKIDLRGTLATAGFEYNLSGATIEITPESVVELLIEFVSPRLRELTQAAIADIKPSSQGSK